MNMIQILVVFKVFNRTGRKILMKHWMILIWWCRLKPE